MVSTLLIPYLGNEKVFTFEKAVKSLSGIDRSHVFDAFDLVMSRKDFDCDVFLSVLTKGAIETYMTCYLHGRVSEFFLKYDFCQLLKYANKIDHWRWWDVIFEKLPEAKGDEIADFLNCLNEVQYWNSDKEVIRKSIDSIATPKEAISVLKKVKNPEYQTLFLNNVKVIDYLKNEATESEVIEIAQIIDAEEVWSKLLSIERVNEYFVKKLPTKDALEVAKKTKIKSVKMIIFGRKNLMNKDLADYARNNDCKVAWEIILSTEFYPAEESLSLSYTGNNQKWVLSPSIFKRDSVLRYLNALDATNSISLIKKYKSYEVSKLALSRDDITFEIKDLFLVLCIHEHYDDIWKIILNRSEMSTYLTSLSDDELINFAKEYNLHKLWDYVVSNISFDKALEIAMSFETPTYIYRVFERKDLKAKPEDLILIGHKIDIYEIWKKILNMPEVKEYIG